MKHRIVKPKDEWSTHIPTFIKTFRENNPYYPIDPFTRVCQTKMEFIMDDNIMYQAERTLKMIDTLPEAPF
jgi:hypothetical protein